MVNAPIGLFLIPCQLKYIAPMKLQIQLLLSLIISISLQAQQKMKPEDTEIYKPVPPVVNGGETPFKSPPTDAIVLFSENSLDQWQKVQFINRKGEIKQRENYQQKPADWIVEGDEFVVKKGTGSIATIQAFGSVQLHIEWMAPKMENKTGQGYSNSGIFFMGIYEIQILNSYESETYSNGQAGSIYKQHIPLVNASNPPGEWQVYDIVFEAPKFNNDGTLSVPASITAFHNGVLIQNHVILKGPTQYIGIPEYIPHPEKLPLQLQDHGDPVRFRNIWIREI